MPEHSTYLYELFEKFDNASLTQGTTRAKCRAAWRSLCRLLGPAFEAGQVTGVHIDRYQRYLRDEAVSRYGRSFSEHSVASYVAAVGEVFAWSAHPDRRFVTSNPVSRCEKFKPTRRQVEVFGSDEIRAMLDTVRGNAERVIAAMQWSDRAGPLRWTAFFLSALCGPRLGEIWNLRWDDIDLDTGVLKIRSRPDCPGEHWRWTAKGKAERDVPMSDDLWAVLCRLKEVASWRYPFLKERTCLDKQLRVGGLSEFARKYPYNNFHRELSTVRAETNERRRRDGLDPIRKGTWHTLRKNAATVLAEAGVPSHFCQQILGHASDRLTKEIYTYVDQRKCLEASRRAFNGIEY